MPNNPLLIGITGGIGAGKSTICRVFSVLGVPVYNADNRAKWLMNNNKSLQDKIIKQFGSTAYTDDGKLNKAYLADTVFNDDAQLKRLNALVHPAVSDDFSAWVQQNSKSPYVIKEAALLFESGSYKQLDSVINVDAPENVRLNRVLLRDQHRSKQQVKAIMSKQFTDRQRKEMATYTVLNDDRKLVIPQVLSLHNEFIST